MFATKKKPSSSQHQNTVSFEDDNFGTQETNEEVGGEQQPAKEKLTLVEIKRRHTVMVNKLDTNIPLQQTIEKLTKDFGYFGTINNIRVPASNGVIRGYAFIEFRKEKQANNAIKDLRKQQKYICAIQKSREDYLKSKEEKQKKGTEDEIDDGESVLNPKKDKKQKKKQPKKKQEKKQEEDSEEQKEQTDDTEKEESNTNNDEEGDVNMSESSSKSKKKNKKSETSDLERTIFVRNLPLDVEVDDINDMFTFYYGKVQKVTVMPHREYDGLSNGTAFVLFANKSSVEAVMKDVEGDHRLREIERKEKKKLPDGKTPRQVPKKLQKEEAPAAGELQYGQVEKLEIEGRHPFITRALSREQAQAKRTETEEEKLAQKDKRNVYLASEGYVPKDSPAAATMPPKYLEKLQKNYQMKMQKLTNPLFHVSKVRLSVQNIPRNFTEKQLRHIFTAHANVDDESLGPPKIKQCKIERERETSKRDENGLPPSKGFGFIEFTKHEHALAALRAINNNPNILEKKKVKKTKIHDGHRFIVEFALDNARKLLMRDEKRKKKDLEKKNAEEGIFGTVAGSNLKRKREQDSKDKKRKAKKQKTK